MKVEDWGRAARVVEARLSELRMDRTALAKAAGLDRKTVDNFLDRGMKPRTDKRGGYEEALGWEYGSLLAVAQGHEPASRSQGPVETVGDDTDAQDFVSKGGGGVPRISDEEVLAVIRRHREELNELERRILGDGTT